MAARASLRRTASMTCADEQSISASRISRATFDIHAMERCDIAAVSLSAQNSARVMCSSTPISPKVEVLIEQARVGSSEADHRNRLLLADSCPTERTEARLVANHIPGR